MKLTSEKFLDGCHKYGWLITVIMNACLMAYFIGGMKADMVNIKDRLDKFENKLDKLFEPISSLIK